MTQRSTSSRLLPTLLWAGYVLNACWAVALRVALFHEHLGTRPFYLRPFAFGAGLVAANALTLWLSLKVARDFTPGSALRRAWRMMAWSGAFGVVRYAAMWFSGFRGRGPVGIPPLRAGEQVAGLIAVLLLLGALLAMRSPFVRMGLGRLRRTDWVATGALTAIAPVLFVLRQNAPVTPFRLPVLIALQQFDPLLIVGSAIAGIMLLRVSRDLEGGSLAVSFRYVTIFGIVRLLALVVILFPVGGLTAPFTAASLASDWLITIAVFYRWRLMIEASKMAREYEKGEAIRTEL